MSCSFAWSRRPGGPHPKREIGTDQQKCGASQISRDWREKKLLLNASFFPNKTRVARQFVAFGAPTYCVLVSAYSNILPMGSAISSGRLFDRRDEAHAFQGVGYYLNTVVKYKDEKDNDCTVDVEK